MVLLPEHEAVGQPRIEDALDHLADFVGLPRRALKERGELRDDVPTRLDGEDALVLRHAREEHLARQAEVGGVEASGERDRPLHQMGDFLEEAVADRLRYYRSAPPPPPAAGPPPPHPPHRP